MLLSSDGKTSLEFLSTPSARRATGKRWPQRQADCHFYPRPPRGGRRLENLVFLQPGGFLSTPSARRATRVPAMQELHHIAFLSTPSARRATLASRVSSMFFTISIHALREEGDISFYSGITDILTFLSTPSARRATCQPESGRYPAGNFYPRPPRGGRPYYGLHKLPHQRISIHALREEGDPLIRWQTPTWAYFYPRPPRGGRPTTPKIGGDASSFLSTPSARRATSWQSSVPLHRQISIHALREEGDPLCWFILGCALIFLSTPSARRATVRTACRRL